MVFLGFFILPLLIAVGGYVFGLRVTFKEMLLQIVAQSAIVGAICCAIYYSNTWDQEIWNGRVAEKVRERTFCEHSYPCNCRSVSCGKDCTTTVCDTCHEHLYDVDWIVRTTNRESLNIARVDRQGVNEPPRWSAVRIGEPTAQAHSYENYIKGAPDSLFRLQGKPDPATPNPDYPGRVYDYYRLDRFVQVGVSLPDARDWNDALSEINAELGHKRQVNIVVVVARSQPRQWFKILERSWIGGKKNDVVLVLSVDDAQKIEWAEVMAWTDRAYFKVKLRDEVLSIGSLNRQKVLGAIGASVDGLYVRKPMSDFAYLRSSVTPTTGQFIFGLIMAVLAALGLTAVMHQNDVFGDEPVRQYAYFR